MMAVRQHTGDGVGNDGPMRRCIVSGKHFPKQALIRFVVGPDDLVVPDLDGKLPGRGFWLSAAPDVVHTACVRRLFKRAARRNVSVPPALVADIERMLARRCLDRVALARRAGQTVAGFEKSALWLRRKTNRAALVFEAVDGADGGKEKIRRLAKEATVVDMFTAAELGGATGSERTVHLVIAEGGLADGILRDVRRLSPFRAASMIGNDR